MNLILSRAESYHHFPRPMLALTEMFRVAKIGVILSNQEIIISIDHYLVL